MDLIRGASRWPDTAGSVLTIGNFDGVHLGHQAIFDQLIVQARRLALPACCVVSFEPLPSEYFRPDAAAARLQGLRDRVAAIRASGIDRLLLLRFDAVLASQQAADFIDDVLIDTLQARHLMIGDDFRFGAGRAGDFALLQRHADSGGFTLEQSATVLVDGARVSSTRVRQHLAQAELAAAARLLGRPYRISGRVVHGEKVGRQLGFPTANVALKTHQPPLRGVFAVIATDAASGARYQGVANLGERPTIGGRKLLLEVHVLDGSPELYGRHLAVDFLHHIRGEQRFDSLDALTRQIAADAEAARDALA